MSEVERSKLFSEGNSNSSVLQHPARGFDLSLPSLKRTCQLNQITKLLCHSVK